MHPPKATNQPVARPKSESIQQRTLSVEILKAWLDNLNPIVIAARDLISLIAIIMTTTTSTMILLLSNHGYVTYICRLGHRCRSCAAGFGLFLEQLLR